jgi:hypothetical protein
MAAEEPSRSEVPQPGVTGAKPPPRRGRRSGRGRRGHGRGARPRPASNEPPVPTDISAPGEEPEEVFELAAEQAEESESDALEEVQAEAPSEIAPPPEPLSSAAGESHPGPGSSVQKAIDEVTGIVDTLRGTLDDMEEVLEMLELFERQQNADEREIESLRRALRQMHRPRDSGHPRR